MSGLKVGDKFPSDVVFKLAPWTNPDPKKTMMPKDYNASKEWEGKRVCLISVPGAFTPGCQGVHLPPYIENLSKLGDKGIDIVAVIATNDAFVMSAWQKVNGVKDEDMLFMSDTGSKLGEKIGWTVGPGADRNARWAMIIDRDGTIKYAEREKSPKDVTVSGVEAVLAKL